MSRRVKLPGAAELFRSTGGEGSELPAAGAAAVTGPIASGTPAVPNSVPRPAADQVAADQRAQGAPTGGTGRVRHDEKITVYVSREELLALEQARLRLRGELGVAVDRGRLVRAAMALALADLDAAGESSELVRRLTAS